MKDWTPKERIIAMVCTTILVTVLIAAVLVEELIKR